MFGEGQLPASHDNITALEVFRVEGLFLVSDLAMPGVYGIWSVPKASSNGFRRTL
jgi:hypothetical protein